MPQAPKLGPSIQSQTHKPSKLYKQVSDSVLDRPLNVYPSSFARQPAFSVTARELAKQLGLDHVWLKGSSLNELSPSSDLRDVDLQTQVTNNNELLNKQGLEAKVSKALAQLAPHINLNSPQYRRLIQSRELANKGQPMQLITIGRAHPAGQTIDLVIGPNAEPAFDSIQASRAILVKLDGSDKAKFVEHWHPWCVRLCAEKDWLWMNPDINNLLLRTAKRVSDNPELKSVQPYLINEYLQTNDATEELTQVLERYFQASFKGHGGAIARRSAIAFDKVDFDAWARMLTTLQARLNQSDESKSTEADSNHTIDAIYQLCCSSQSPCNLSSINKALEQKIALLKQAQSNQGIDNKIHAKASACLLELFQKASSMHNLRGLVHEASHRLAASELSNSIHIPQLIGLKALSVDEVSTSLLAYPMMGSCPKPELKTLLGDYAKANRDKPFQGLNGVVFNWLSEAPYSDIPFLIEAMAQRKIDTPSKRIQEQLTALLPAFIAPENDTAQKWSALESLLNKQLGPTLTNLLLAELSAYSGAQSISSPQLGEATKFCIQLSKLGRQVNQIHQAYLQNKSQLNNPQQAFLCSMISLYPRLNELASSIDDNRGNLPQSLSCISKKQGDKLKLWLNQIEFELSKENPPSIYITGGLNINVIPTAAMLEETTSNAQQEVNIAWHSGANFVGRREGNQLKGQLKLPAWTLQKTHGLRLPSNLALLDQLSPNHASHSRQADVFGGFSIDPQSPVPAKEQQFLALMDNGFLKTAVGNTQLTLFFKKGELVQTQYKMPHAAHDVTITEDVNKLQSNDPRPYSITLAKTKNGSSTTSITAKGALVHRKRHAQEQDLPLFEGRLSASDGVSEHAWFGHFNFDGVRTPGTFVSTEQATDGEYLLFPPNATIPYEALNSIGTTYAKMSEYGVQFSPEIWTENTWPAQGFEGFVTNAQLGNHEFSGYLNGEGRAIGKVRRLDPTSPTDYRAWVGNFATAPDDEMCNDRLTPAMSEFVFTGYAVDSQQFLFPHGGMRPITTPDNRPARGEPTIYFFYGRPVAAFDAGTSFKSLIQLPGHPVVLPANGNLSENFGIQAVKFWGSNPEQDILDYKTEPHQRG